MAPLDFAVLLRAPGPNVPVPDPGGFDGIPDSLAGKTVLDVGPGQGFFAFEFEARGAARVTTVELPTWTAHDASPVLRSEFERDRHAETKEAYLHGALELAMEARGSKVQRQFYNVYDISPENVGTYDLVFCASVLLHLTDPLRAMYVGPSRASRRSSAPESTRPSTS